MRNFVYRIKSILLNLWWTNIRNYKPIKKMSVLGSFEQVKKINDCSHEWKLFKGIIFDYILVNARCNLCGTYKE